MSKVYLVMDDAYLYGSYSAGYNGNILGIFTSKEKAQEVIEKRILEMKERAEATFHDFIEKEKSDTDWLDYWESEEELIKTAKDEYDLNIEYKDGRYTYEERVEHEEWRGTFDILEIELDKPKDLDIGGFSYSE